jgi:hypothetical protein
VNIVILFLMQIRILHAYLRILAVKHRTAPTAALSHVELLIWERQLHHFRLFRDDWGRQVHGRHVTEDIRYQQAEIGGHSVLILGRQFGPGHAEVAEYGLSIRRMYR